MIVYTITERHPCYKQGLRIEKKHENVYHLLGNKDELYLNTGSSTIGEWLSNGWITEAQTSDKPALNMGGVSTRLLQPDIKDIERAYDIIDQGLQEMYRLDSVLSESEKIKLSDSLHIVRESCDWKKADYGMMGCPDYEYKTTCGKQFDAEKTNKLNYCPNCGGKINSL